MENNKKFQLSESDLKFIVENSIQCILSENEMDELNFKQFLGGAKHVADGIKNGANKMGNSVKNSVNNMGSNMKNAAANVGNKMRGAAENMGNKMRGAAENMKTAANNAKGAVSQYAQGVKQAGIDYANNSDIDSAIKTIQGLSERGLVNPKAAQMVIASMKKYKVQQ